MSIRIVLVGPPASGKGTQANVLSEGYAVPKISTGDMLREAKAAGTALGKEAEKFMTAGKLVPDEVVIGLVDERLNAADAENGFILDGFPRTTAQAERIHAAYPDQLHPIVRTNPDTGAKALYLTDRTVMQSIEGMSQAESDVLLDFLLAHVDQPRFHVRWHWAEGDIAIWDERTTLHRGVSDHHPQRRVVRRCTVDGEVPA